MRASSWASTTTRRARSVNRSNMGIAPWTSRVGQTCDPHDCPTLLPAYVFRRNRVFALSEQTGVRGWAVPSGAGPQSGADSPGECAPSVRGDVRLADLRGDATTIGHVEAVVAGPGPDVRGARSARPARTSPAAARGLAGVADVRRECVAQLRGILLAQVDF